MKKIILISIFLLSLKFSIWAQCHEPVFEKTGKIIASKSFEVKNEAASDEFILSLEASTQNSSWERKGAESAVLTIFLDGKYNQDIILFAGAEKFSYQIALGKIIAGKHKFTAVFNNERSAKNIGEVKIFSLTIKPFLMADSSADRLAVSNSPILYLRPDTIDKFSDIPLVTYYEILKGDENTYKIRYTTIFTNEDGGTQTRALMGRWGRGTDIEWFYEIEIKNESIRSEIYQGANHVTGKFAGKRELGNHPIIFDTTNNNNFSDTGCSGLRTVLVPIKTDLSKKSREAVMDENPWTYRIMAEELTREGRVNPQKMDINTIDDLRNYLYVEVYSENDSTAVAVEAQTADEKISSSDVGDPKIRVDRSGYKRIAVRLPSIDSSLHSLSLFCRNLLDSKVMGSCQNSRIIKYIRLDRNFRPLEKINPDLASQTLKPDEKLIWNITGK